VGAPVALAVSRWRFSRLRRADPRPFGLAVTPSAVPMMLSSEGWQPGLASMALRYGRPLAAPGPFVEVATSFLEPDCDMPSLKQVITRAEKRDAAWARRLADDITGKRAEWKRTQRSRSVPTVRMTAVT
jgi:hypothetical protein